MPTDIVTSFLEQAVAECTTTNQIISTCSYDNIDLSNCKNVDLACVQSVTTTGLACDPIMVASKVADLLARLAASDEKARSSIDAQVKSTNAHESDSIKATMQTFLEQKCSMNNAVTQDVGYPSVVLSNCNDVTLLAVNRLDVQTKCALGWASKILGLVEPPAAIPTPPAPGPAGPVEVLGLPPYAFALIITGIVILLVMLFVILLRNK